MYSNSILFLSTKIIIIFRLFSFFFGSSTGIENKRGTTPSKQNDSTCVQFVLLKMNKHAREKDNKNDLPQVRTNTHARANG